MSESNLNEQIENLLKEMKEIKENQKAMNEKMEKMQQVIKHIESDIYLDEDCDCDCDFDFNFDFEIVCPYCEYEFVIDADEQKNEIECPECKNIIELDWSGDLCEDDECSGHCHGCSGCGDSDEDDM